MMNNPLAAIEELSSQDGVIRERARKALVAAKGDDVVHALIAELVDPRQRVRWEAAKALSDIAAPVAALPLVHAMHDEDTGVAWLAAEGIARLGEPGLLALLSGLTRASQSPGFCKAAHHALKEFSRIDERRDVIQKVLTALEGPEPKLTAPVVAFQSLEELRIGEVTDR